MIVPPSRSLRPWPRYFSLALVFAVIAYALVHPAGLGSHGTLFDRLFGALLMVGALGAALHGLGWESERRHIRLLADRRFAWPAVGLGAAWGLIAPLIA